MVGQLLGRYRVEEKIGEGGMGVVYRAQDTRLNRTVALKLIHPDLLRDEEARQRFLREAQAASAMEHPNICTIHSIEETDGQLFLVLEYLDGQTLKQLHNLHTDARRMLDIAVQVTEGLAEAHRRFIVHRDIKSSNIMVTGRGLVKIMDFGLAKQVRRRARTVSAGAETTEITDTGVTIGTTAYMSPEQTRGRDVDERGDIFSLGVVLYEISTGRLPFTGATPVEVMDAVLNKEPAPPTRLNPDLPLEFERTVLKSLRKEPGERYASAADMLVDLKSLRREVETGPRSARMAAPPGGAEARPAAWKSALLVLGAMVLLVAATIGGVLAFSGKRQQEIPAASLTGRPSLAVMNFENHTGDDRFGRYGQGAAELLTVELAHAGNMDLVSSQRMFDVLRELKKEMPSLDRTVATEIARRCGARLMLHGNVLKVADSVILKAEIIEVQSGRLVSAQRVVGVDDRNLLEKIDELSRLVREDLKALR